MNKTNLLTKLLLLCLMVVGSANGVWAQTLIEADDMETTSVEGSSLTVSGFSKNECTISQSTEARTGSYSLKTEYNGTGERAVKTTNASISVGANVYLHVIAWAKLESTDETSASSSTQARPNAYIGGNGTRNAVNLTTTWQQITSYKKASSAVSNAYVLLQRKHASKLAVLFDDVVIYTSTNSTTDITAPSAATSASATASSISWINGNDYNTGIQNTLIFRRTSGSSDDLALNNQGKYAVDGTDQSGHWTLVSASVAADATSYAGTFSGGARYAIVHRDLAYNYSTPTYVTIPAADVKYTVSFNAGDHGTYTGGDITQENVGDEITLPSLTTLADGYDFNGWFTEATDGDKIGDAGDTYGPSEDITLYAQYSAKTYTVTLNANTLQTSEDGSATATYNSNTLTSISAPVWAGHYVTGYYSASLGGDLVADAEGNLQKDKSGFTDEDGNWTATEDKTLWAQWLPEKYTLTIAPNEDGWGTVDVTSITDIDYNTAVTSSTNTFIVGETTVTATAAAATAEYTYAFSKWTDLPANVTENATVTATFARTANSYTLAWNANGGDDLTGEYTTGTVAYGTTLTAPTTPTRTDYDFAGWNTANDGTGDAYTGTMPAANTTYYAQWTPSVDYDLPMTTLRPTDATGTDVEISSQVNDGFTLTSNNTLNKSDWGENFPNTLKVNGTVTVTAPANAMLQAIKIYGMSNDKSGATRTVTAGSGATITSGNNTLQARNDDGNLSEITVEANTPALANAISFSVSGQSRIYVVVYGLFGISPKKTYTTLTSYYDLDFTDIDGLTAYIIKDDDTSDDAVTVTPINKVSGGVGLVIKATSTDKTYLVPVFTGAADDATGNYMEGSASETTAIAENGGYILKDGKFHPSTAGTLAAGKAYLNIAVTSARALTLNFDDETTTDIKATLKKNEVMNNEVYNLAGQRVAQPQKGLYIMNGKKVVIK